MIRLFFVQGVIPQARSHAGHGGTFCPLPALPPPPVRSPRDPTLFASASFLAFSLAAWAFLRSASCLAFMALRRASVSMVRPAWEMPGGVGRSEEGTCEPWDSRDRKGEGEGGEEKYYEGAAPRPWSILGTGKKKNQQWCQFAVLFFFALFYFFFESTSDRRSVKNLKLNRGLIRSKVLF